MPLNQFAQSVMPGMVDLTIFNQIFTFQHKVAEATPIFGSDLVRLDATAVGQVPVVTACTAATQKPAGLSILNPMRQSTKGGQLLEVAAPGSTIYVTFSVAVQRDQLVAFNAKGTITGQTVTSATYKVAATGNYAIGKVLDPTGINGVGRIQLIEPVLIP